MVNSRLEVGDEEGTAGKREVMSGEQQARGR